MPGKLFFAIIGVISTVNLFIASDSMKTLVAEIEGQAYSRKTSISNIHNASIIDTTSHHNNSIIDEVFNSTR